MVDFGYTYFHHFENSCFIHMESKKCFLQESNFFGLPTRPNNNINSLIMESHVQILIWEILHLVGCTKITHTLKEFSNGGLHLGNFNISTPNNLRCT